MQSDIKKIFDEMLEGCQVISPDWRYLYVNNALAKQGRRTKEGLIGHTMMEAYPGIEKTPMFKQLGICMKRGKPQQFANEFKFPDGSQGWSSLRMERIQEGVLIFTFDITDQKNAEADLESRNKELERLNKAQEENKANLLKVMDDLKKFQMAVADSSDQIVIADSEGNVLFANHATEKITGFSIEEIVGTKAGALWGGRVNKDYYKKLWKTIKVDRKPFAAKVDNKRKNGEIYTADIHISPVLDKKGKPVYFVAIERDITREEMINRAKTEFISVTSHQLRTPLGIAKWHMEALRAEDYFKEAPDIISDYLDEIYNSNERVLSIVRDLLSVSRIEQGRVRDNPKHTDIIRLLKDLIEEVGIITVRQDIRLELVIKPTKLPLVYIDPLRLHEVLENLIVNAVQYNVPNGSVTVILDKKDPKTIRIRVKDTGIGLSKEDRARLFTKFLRSERGSVRNTDGSGLGLYVVKSYVEGWGGKVDIRSEEGKGSTFTITIPTHVKKMKERKPIEKNTYN